MADMETRIVANATVNDATGNEAGRVKKSDGKAIRELSKGEKEKPVWNKEPRFGQVQ
jgi:hypothetical protein